MKKTVSILLILVMSAQSLYRLGMVTWFEMNREYIAKVLCINKTEPEKGCNGQCYLKKNLQKTDTPDNTPQSSAREKSPSVDFLVEAFACRFTPAFRLLSEHSGYYRFLPEGTTHSVFHPPSPLC
jgi:hypothetical protein